MSNFQDFIPSLVTFYSLLHEIKGVLGADPEPPGAVDRSDRKAEAVIFPNTPFWGLVGSSLAELGGDKFFGVCGLEDTVTESLKSIAGALASGVSGRTYGTSGCLEYGKTGNTVTTP
jgi:hypothetical protein